MLGRLALLFILIPALEILILLQSSEVIGIIPTFSLVVFTGITGAFLARQQGLSVLRNINADLSVGRMPTDRLMDAGFVLAGGLLLLTPGFLTDGLGFLLLIPPSREFCKRMLRRWLETRVESGYIMMWQA